MQRLSLHTRALIAGILLGPAVASADPPDRLHTPIEEIFLEGSFHFDLRLRYEYANQTGLDASHAATARTRIGYETNNSLPLFGYVELEDIRALDSGGYNQAGLNNRPEKTVIADPETTELNQAFLAFSHEDAGARLGRQRIVLDNHRFVGNVGWRQNEQTYDAFSATWNPLEEVSLYYGYIDQVNRVFGRDHPMGVWDSDSHLFNVRGSFPVVNRAGAYVYLLKFDDAPASSSNTAGFWVRPHFDNMPAPASLHLEVAGQTDNSRSPAGTDFSHSYLRAELETRPGRFTAGAGFERMRGDGETAFQTPLATLHAFNGWADQFLATPAQGLEDVYLFASVKLPALFTAQAKAHHFSSTRDSVTYGHELDLLLSRPLGRHANALAKAAFFDGKNRRPDVTKFWLQSELRF